MTNHRRMSYFTAFIALLVATVVYGSGAPAEGDRQTIEGLVRDISCPLQNKAATAVKFNLQCARQCIKQGSPIIILSKDGEIYIPISDSMPDKSQRERLLPFIGKYVRATGHVFEIGFTCNSSRHHNRDEERAPHYRHAMSCRDLTSNDTQEATPIMGSYLCGSCRNSIRLDPAWI